MKIKDFIIAMLTGIGIGIPVTLICMISIGGFNEVIKEFLVWTVASALFGVLSVVTLSNDRVNRILATTIHCIGCLLITLGACTIIGYIENVTEFLFAIASIFVVVYLVIFFAGFFMMKNNAKKTNEALSRK